MKLQKLAASLAALALSSAAWAADSDRSTASQWLVDASKLDGTVIYDFHGQKLGDLKQILIDPNSGRIRYGVLEVDKSWSWNEPEVAVPWGTFTVKEGADKAVQLSLNASKEKLEKAPKFKAGDASRLYAKEASQPVYSYWGIYWIDEPTPVSADKKSTAGQSATNGNASASSSNAATKDKATPQ